MKKQFYFLLGILLAFSSLIISCDENEQDSNICKITVESDGDGIVSIANYIGTSVNVLTGNQVEVVATPAAGNAFIGWYLADGETLLSTEAKFIFTASENTTLIAKFSRLSNLTLLSAGYGSVSCKDSADGALAFLPGTEVTVVATADEDCDFVGWYIGEGDEPVSTDAEYTFTMPEEDITLTAKFIPLPINGYEWVDLGLPSGIKWAACNVGATKPEEYGGYYAWGETEEKEDYSWETYKWANGNEVTITKYCTDSNIGTVDNKTVLDLEDDVAHVKWGGSWRMPTLDEQQELLNNCTWSWTTQNGVNGCKVTSKTNGNSIFLPAAGCRYGTSLNVSGFICSYWSNSLNDVYSGGAYGLAYSCDYYELANFLRSYGYSVRPVSE